LSKGAAWQLEDHHFIAALRHDRVTAPFVLEGPMTGEMFKALRTFSRSDADEGATLCFMDNVSGSQSRWNRRSH